MEKIKKFFAEFKQEALESFKGVSKAAVSTVVWIETLLILLLVTVCLIFVFKVAISESMTSHALELRAAALEQRDDYKTQRDQYKELYRSALEELDKHQEDPPQD